MKVQWVSQENPTSAEDALEKSIAKWRFFSYCTKTELKNANCEDKCGLCNWHSIACMRSSGTCVLYATDGACNENPLILDAYAAANFVGLGTCTLAQFHAAARKVFAKLRSLR